MAMTTDTPELFPGVQFVTVDELAEVMRLSKMTVYRMIRDEKVRSRKWGRSIRIPVADARALVLGDT
jgi:excisionase family DNA binding protein